MTPMEQSLALVAYVAIAFSAVMLAAFIWQSRHS